MKWYFILKIIFAVLFVLIYNNVKGSGLDLLFMIFFVADFTLIPIVFLILIRKGKIRPGEYRIKPGKQL